MTQIVLSQLLPYQDTTAVSTTSKHRTYLPGCLDYNRYRRSPTVHRTVWCAGTPDGKDASVGTPPCCRCFSLFDHSIVRLEATEATLT